MSNVPSLPIFVGEKIPIFIMPSYNHRYKADIRGAKWECKGQTEDDTIKMRRLPVTRPGFKEFHKIVVWRESIH